MKKSIRVSIISALILTAIIVALIWFITSQSSPDTLTQQISSISGVTSGGGGTGG